MSGLLFVLGLGLLVAGAELLVRGAARLAALTGLSPLVVGLTVVAFGTSAPELAVSVRAALEGQAGADLALGNVVGSNIFNVLLILGASAVVTPLAVTRKLVRFDVPLMIGASLFVLLLALDGRIGRGEGLLLFAGIVAYTVFAVRSGRETGAGGGRSETTPRTPARVAGSAVMAATGLALLVVGAGWLVAGAVAIATWLGVGELVVGLTVVSAGTSLPELATSVVASVRGQRDIAVGNVVGSNLFNLLAVLGLSSAVAPDGIGVSGQALRFDLPVMVGTAVVCLPVFFTGSRIARWEGVMLLAGYAAYVICLVLLATGSPAFGPLRVALLVFALPLTAAALAVTTWRERRR
jgi:cation:H+ antiporter